MLFVGMGCTPHDKSKKKEYFRAPLLLGLVTSSLLSLQAQEEAPEELDAFISQEIVDPLGILPTREIDSVFGIEKNILEIPRSVSIVEGSTLESYGIDSVGDIAAVSAGTFSNNQFGIEGNVDIRNANGDNYFRGFKKLTNRGNFRTPIGAADRFEVIKGPPPVFYGVGSIGGLLNYHPKTARGKDAKYFDKAKGKVTATVGTYDKKKLNLEYGTPFQIGDNRGGIYTFVGVEDSGSYYNLLGNEDLIAQLTTVYDINDKLTTEFGFQYGDFDQIQNPGWNRVTQELVDSGTYYSGVSSIRPRDLNGSGRLEPAETDGGTGFGQFTNGVPAISVGFIGRGGGVTVGGVDLDEWIANTITEGANGIDIDYDGDGILGESFASLDNVTPVALDSKDGFTDTEDYGLSENITGFFDLKFEASDVLSIKNQVFYDWYDTKRNTTYGFNNEYKGYVLENKLTVNWSPEVGDDLKLNVIAGADYRYTEMDAFSDFLTEPFNYRDLSVPPTGDDRIALGSSNHLETPGFNRSVNIFDNYVENHYSDFGVFVSTDFTVKEKLNFNVGVTQHWVDMTSQNKGWLNRDNAATKVSETDNYTNFSGSVSYTLPSGFVPYFTMAETSFIDDGQASEIDYGQVTNKTFIQGSDLREIGLKGSLLDSSMFFSIAAYKQNRAEYNAILGASIDEKTEGVELEINYALNEQFFFTGTATWLKTVRKGSFDILGVSMEFIAEQMDISVMEAFEKYGSMRFNAFGGPIVDTFSTDPEEPGRPDKTFSFYGNYVGGNGFSATLGFIYYPSVASGFMKYVELPSYTEWNASMSYTFNENWSARVNVSNLFDETGYKSQNLFFDELVLATAGRQADLSISYKW